MNWVGGSRNRLVMKNDAKRQREFFEKRKMRQKLKNLGISLPESPRGTSSASMDLVTLFIVNQIAAKKESKDPPKVAVLGNCKVGSKHKRHEPLVLPMSPCPPSQLSLVESQPECSVQGTRKRKHVIPQRFKVQLSPVLESAFSDNSASDYLPPATDPLSPFSSISSASSGQGGVAKYYVENAAYECIFSISVNFGQIKLLCSGMFPLQLNLQMQAQPPPHRPPPPWDTPGLEQTRFQPFSQSRGVADSMPWSYGSNPPLYQLETPTAARVLFGSPQSDNMETRVHARREVAFPLSEPESKEAMLDFTLNQSGPEQQFEEGVFRGFSTDECHGEAFRKSKIHLRDETPVKSSTAQTVPDSQCMELSNSADMNCSRLEHNSGPLNGCDCSPSYSCRGGYISSDSNEENEDEECCEPRLQAASSGYLDQAHCADSINSNLGSQENPKPRHAQPRPLSPFLKPIMNFRGDQRVVEDVPRPDEAFRSDRQQTGSNAAQKTSSETRDAGTQTVDKSAAETCDASTQCSFAVDSTTTANGLSSCLSPVDVSVQHPATGRQADTAAEPDPHTPSSGKARSEWKHTPWSEKKSRTGSLSGHSFLNKFTANNSEGKVILQRPINPFLGALSITDGKDKGNEEGRGERGQSENGRLMKDLSNEVMEEVTSATRVNRLSEETETLQELADILLLLKQRKEEGW